MDEIYIKVEEFKEKSVKIRFASEADLQLMIRNVKYYPQSTRPRNHFICPIHLDNSYHIEQFNRETDFNKISFVIENKTSNHLFFVVAERGKDEVKCEEIPTIPAEA